MFMSPLEAWFLRDIRAGIIPSAAGDVLEIGIGTGVNGQYYDYSRVNSLTGLDCEFSPEVDRHYPKEKFSFALGDIERLPFDARRFDSIVATLILCTVNLEKGLNEIKRVLKPGGQFIFIEHVRPPGAMKGKLFDMVNRVWPSFAKGCNLNRRTDAALAGSGFADVRIKRACGDVFIYGSAMTSL